ncbi:PAAR domain-containing protein [Chitiniphilus purpureus]|uniref:PAAR domain-containing protein n=1 Tax=Chitiniphilus purpureus TaxID=2981137 RepID=A0ABY6DXT4_9NEIS|nr:PAAR domain-containing protein [Chitiniphilus sp. CD1]UXY16648.1 PAAR domain-containing protein [Chitiniphilus sp. CD1]
MPGKLFVVLGDKTSHGGTVVSAQSPMTFDGKPIATIGDMTVCPQCKGSFAIVQGGGNISLLGRQLAREGDKTACGAVLLAGGQTRGTHEQAGGGSGAAAAISSKAAPAAAAAQMLTPGAPSDAAHEVQFLVEDDDGNPLPYRDYLLTRADGSTKLGKTDSNGLTEAIHGNEAESVSISVLFKAPKRMLEKKEVRT